MNENPTENKSTNEIIANYVQDHELTPVICPKARFVYPVEEKGNSKIEYVVVTGATILELVKRPDDRDLILRGCRKATDEEIEHSHLPYFKTEYREIPESPRVPDDSSTPEDSSATVA